MPFVLDLSPAKAEAVRVDLPDGSNFELLVTPPSLEAELSATFTPTSIGAQVAETITGWRGVNDAAGNPIPFSRHALAVLMRKHRDAVAMPLLRAFNAIYPGEDAEKNSAAPRSDSSDQSSAANPTT